jgi:hypothetical protein
MVQVPRTFLISDLTDEQIWQMVEIIIKVERGDKGDVDEKIEYIC